MTRTFVEQFAPIAEAFQIVCHHKQPKWKAYERVNQNFMVAETWLHQFGETLSLFSEDSIESSWRPNSEQETTWWNCYSSSHRPCRHFLQQEHGRCSLERPAKKLLCRGPQVAQVVALFVVVSRRCEHCQCSHFRKWGRKSSHETTTAVSRRVGKKTCRGI